MDDDSFDRELLFWDEDTVASFFNVSITFMQGYGPTVYAPAQGTFCPRPLHGQWVTEPLISAEGE